MPRKYLSGPQLRARFGGISDMTLWRWLKDEGLTFPKPLIINGRRFFALDEIEKFEEAHAAPRTTETA